MHQTINGRITSQMSISHPLGRELREKYPDFKEVAMGDWGSTHILAYKNSKFSRLGMHVEPQFTRMFSLKMVKGVQDGLQEINSVMINESLSQALFGEEDPIGKTVKIDNKSNLKVTGVFKDFAHNSDFKGLDILTTWEYYKSQEPWVKNSYDKWAESSFQCFVQLNENADFNQVSAK